MRTMTAALAFLAVWGCAGGTPISGDVRNVGAVTLSFRVEPSRVKPGQSVRLTLHLQNNAGRETVLRYPSGQRYDFAVRKGDAEIWRWSSGRAFTQAEESETLPGSFGKPYSEVWRPDDPGTYTVSAELKAEGFARALDGEIEVR